MAPADDCCAFVPEAVVAWLVVSGYKTKNSSKLFWPKDDHYSVGRSGLATDIRSASERGLVPADDCCAFVPEGVVTWLIVSGYIKKAQNFSNLKMICRMRARKTAGASRGVGRGASYITHRHLNHRLPAVSYVRMTTLGRTTSPAGVLRTPLQLVIYVPPFYFTKNTNDITRISNDCSRKYHKRYKVYKSNTTNLLWNTGSSKWQHVSAFYSNKAIIRSSKVT